MALSLDLLAYQHKLLFKDENKHRFIFCVIRKKYLVLTPEEMVRQLFVQYLLESNYPKGRIAVEKELQLHGQKKRFDLIVVDEQGKTFLLAEFKAPSVKITDKTITQISNYNVTLKAEELVVSNGISTHWFVQSKEEGNTFLEKVI